MSQDFSKELFSWCFAAAVAWFLLRWVTAQLSARLAKIERASNLQAITNLELYRLLLVHDAQTRGVNPHGEDEQEGIHRLAFDEYQKLNDSLSNLKEQIKNH